MPEAFSLFLPEWKSLLENEFSQDYMKKLREFLISEKKRGLNFVPKKENVFRAFHTVDYSQVKVVILGQDPYHGENQANGFAFAVPEHLPAPPSLQNIFKEIESDLKIGKPKNNTLESWANQGVLLLNTVLTVRLHEAFSHREKGWELFTDKIISHLNNQKNPIVFLLWGSAAIQKSKLMTNSHHKILTAPHTSPLSAYRGFFGCKHFSKTNEFLKSIGQNEMSWV